MFRTAGDDDSLQKYVDSLTKENTELRQQLDKLVRENRDLKRTVLDLNMHASSLRAAAHHHKSVSGPHQRPGSGSAASSSGSGPTSVASSSSHLQGAAATSLMTGWQPNHQSQPQPQSQHEQQPQPQAHSYRSHPSHQSHQHQPRRDVFDLEAALQEQLSRREEEEGSIDSSSVVSWDAKRLAGSACELKGHSGAVHCVKFAPPSVAAGQRDLVASGSIDSTVRLWNAVEQTHVATLEAHTSNVSDVAWTPDGRQLASGSFDRTVRLHDVEAREVVHRQDTDGFVQCVGISPRNPAVVFAGTTKRQLCMFDTREPSSGSGSAGAGGIDGSAAVDGGSRRPSRLLVENDAMINSLYPFCTGVYVTTGDSKGFIKTWDMRNLRCVCETRNDPLGCSVTCLAASAGSPAREGRCFASVSYDNVLRVYDRGPLRHPTASMPVVHSFTHQQTKNWPVRCAFGRYSKESFENGIPDVGAGLSVDDDGEDGQGAEVEGLMLATGSADTRVYVYGVCLDASTQHVGEVQQLSGHSGRVYDVDFHPTHPLIASCSADTTVRIWPVKPTTGPSSAESEPPLF
eukprot:m.148376 g.148376  ORF g.148376 m.148376 type:complete len:572 (-) comp17312_c0_seq1:271-1986(-)